MNCPACNYGKANLFLRASHLRAKADVMLCKRCGTAFFEGRAWRMQPDYWTAGDQEKIYSSNMVHTQRVRRFVSRLSLISKFAQERTLLDIGCGRGDFLACAEARGWSVNGVEPSTSVVAVSEEIDNRIERLPFENVKNDFGPFDVITMWDVIEHVEKPDEDMKKIFKLLKPGGIAAIETPNEKGLFKILAHGFARLGMRKFLDYVYYLPHRVAFSAKGLRLLGQRAGLNMIYSGTSTTDIAFAVEKVLCHYPPGLTTACVTTFAPVAAVAARVLGIGNKLIIILQKPK